MNIYNEIATHADQLNTHPMMGYFKHTESITSRSFAFAPKMAFFVLGFKDILATASQLSRQSPQSPLDKAINVHCEEDADHWLWFLEDLSTLSDLDLIGELDIAMPTALLADIWSEQGFGVRRHTYFVIELLSEETCAERKLMIIECLEAAFSIFISNLTYMTRRANLYDKLKYFGREHHSDEAQHSMGSWFDGEKGSGSPTLMQGKDSEAMLAVIQKIFSGFHDMFDYWYSAMQTSDQRKPIQAAPAPLEFDLV